MADEEVIIVKLGDIVNIFKSSNQKISDADERNKDILEMVGEHSDLALKIGSLGNNEKHQETLDAIDNAPAAKETPYFRLVYGISLNLRGYDRLKQSKLEEAVNDFNEARKYVDGCENAFDAPRWNNEVNAYRFVVRKHQGDCSYEKAERCFHEGNAKGYYSNLNEMQEYYLEAVKLYDKTLKSTKECFSNTAVSTLINLSNLYIMWAKATAGTIDPMNMLVALMTGDDRPRKTIDKAWKLINNGKVLQETAGQLIESLGYGPQYNATLNMLKSNSALIYHHIKTFHDMVNGELPGM